MNSIEKSKLRECLLELFLRLRDAGIILDIEDYQLIVKALEADFISQKDQETIIRLCYVIWIKSEDQKQLFNYHFKQAFSTLNISTQESNELVDGKKIWYLDWFKKNLGKQQSLRRLQYTIFSCIGLLFICIFGIIVRRLFVNINLPSSSSSSETFVIEKILESEDSKYSPSSTSPDNGIEENQDYFEVYPERKKPIIQTLKKFQDLKLSPDQYLQMELPNIDFQEFNPELNNSPEVSINKVHLEQMGLNPEEALKEGISPELSMKKFTEKEIRSAELNLEEVTKDGIPPEKVLDIKITQKRSLKLLRSSPDELDQFRQLGNTNLATIYRYGYLLNVIDCATKVLNETPNSKQIRGFLRNDCLSSNSIGVKPSLSSKGSLSEFFKVFNKEQIQQLGMVEDKLSEKILNGILPPIRPEDITRLSEDTERTVLIFLVLLTIGIRCIPIPVHRQHNNTEDEPNFPDTNALPPPFPPAPTKAPNQQNDEASLGSYLPIDQCLPMTRRQMQQIWRRLHHRVREGKSTELDISATIQQIEREGLLSEPIFLPNRVNRTELLLLIDYHGSMMPFHIVTRQLVNTLYQAGRLSGLNIYYFSNCPGDFLHHDPLLQKGISVDEVINSLHPARTVVLILSDAGSARPKSPKEPVNEKRVNETELFLERLRNQVRRIVWLNPEPQTRWTGTTAEVISKQVPMFELDLQGLKNAISFLQGQTQCTRGRGG